MSAPLPLRGEKGFLLRRLLFYSAFRGPEEAICAGQCDGVSVPRADAHLLLQHPRRRTPTLFDHNPGPSVDLTLLEPRVNGGPASRAKSSPRS